MRKDIGAYHAPANGTNGTNGASTGDLDIEVLIVGAGFGGIYLLHHLRKQGFDCKIVEAGTALGGTWHWNCYPGARVDSQVPIYEYSIPEVWKDWTWTEKYPGWEELHKYFDHVENVLQVKKDVFFNTKVVSANFDKPSGKWVVNTEDGRTIRAKFFLVSSGFAAKRHFPEWKNVEKFQGVIHHSSFWPGKDVDFKGKRVAVVGTGSTGVQMAQEMGKSAASVTVFQRTPNLALPMQQGPLSKEEQEKKKSTYPDLFKYRQTTFAGFQYDFDKTLTFEHSPEEREKFYEGLWERGGFEFWLATYDDMLFDQKANREAYDFWAKKTRARISDPKKRDILAPLEPPHCFGTKRPSLEQNYYEILDRPENEVVNIRETPIQEVTEKGLITSDGKLREFDIIAIATGFDSVTGSMKYMGLRDVDGKDLSEKWKNGTWTYLGMTIGGFPNMFFLYGAHGPTAFSNGPSCVECQGDWIVDALVKIRKEGIKYIDATTEAEKAWRQHVTEKSDETLFPLTDSWYMGANVPGKPREQLNYAGGIPLYDKKARQSLNNGFEGFVTA